MMNHYDDVLYKNLINTLAKSPEEVTEILKKTKVLPHAHYSGEHLSFYFAKYAPQKLAEAFDPSIQEKNYSTIIHGAIVGKQWDFLFNEMEQKTEKVFFDKKFIVNQHPFLEFVAKYANTTNDLEKLTKQKWFNWRDYSNKGFMEYAILVKNELLLEETLKHRKITSKHDKENTVLHLAVFQNDLDAVKLAIKHGADINLFNSMDGGETPLIMAIKTHNKKLKLNFSQYANTEPYNIEKMSQRDTAISIMQYLLESGVDINLKNKKGRDAFFYAIQLQDIVAIKLMLGKDVNLQMKKTGAQGHGQSILDVLDKKIQQALAMKNISPNEHINKMHNSLIEFKANLEMMGIKKEVDLAGNKRKIMKL